MKTRSGFVSNSSSSSFIIACKTNEVCPHCGRSDIDIIEMIESREKFDCDESSVSCIGALDIYNKWIKSNEEFMQYEDVASKKKQYDEMLLKSIELEKNGYKIADVEISYHDEELKNMFSQKIKEKSIIILDGSDEI